MEPQNYYLEILKESLLKKRAVLDQLLKKNEEQTVIIKEHNMDLEAFDKNVEEKMALIEEIKRLDIGFESVYEHVKTDLAERKAVNKDDILYMQKLIGEITDRSVAIETGENRNKQMIEQHFNMMRKEMRKNMVSVKAANSYYRNMNKVNYVDPQLMDRKK